MNFATLQGLTIPQGVVTQIADASGRVLWKLETSKPVVLQVEKITSDTYAGETTYTGEQFILLDIYPKTNGTVKITYGGLTKTITDTSGAEEPNAQQVFFGTFNGVSDSVETPASGELTIDGDYYAFGCGSYSTSNKVKYPCNGVTDIKSFGGVSLIPDNAFGYSSSMGCSKIKKVDIPQGVQTIGNYAFNGCIGIEQVTIPSTVTSIGHGSFSKTHITSIIIPESVTAIGSIAFKCEYLTDFTILATTPPTAVLSESNTWYLFISESVPTITVPKGCGAAYRTAAGWNEYADKIVEAS